MPYPDKAELEAMDHEGNVVDVSCDCGQEHRATVLGDEGTLLEWYCPVEQKLKRDVNV